MRRENDNQSSQNSGPLEKSSAPNVEENSIKFNKCEIDKGNLILGWAFCPDNIYLNVHIQKKKTIFQEIK